MTVPEIEQARTWTAVIGTEPVVILLPRLRGVLIAESGALVSADGWTTAWRDHGAQPMTDMLFESAATPGWSVTLTDAFTRARIAGPDGLGGIYTGELAADPQWCRQVEQRGRAGVGLVVISGTAEQLDPDAALAMMEAGRAVWVRAALSLS
ncbi:hypothetical protein [Nocardia brasiliensis]|uniref:hypothetical protein n=1 Tax=Nocardia brasiliensis TaxID=37326 RepID=UPI0018938381|nr:hypothetical protein [Nocardia brasiliensis]MBF6548892.1 hypothetical protein [Nocardia brasiliensis]